VVKNLSCGWIIAAGLRVVFCAFIWLGQAQAQVRGVYPLGMSALNSGVTPEPGFTYSNLFLFYSRNQFVGPAGEVLATGGYYRKVSLAVKYFKEFSNRATFQGYSLQITGSISF
jgi:hypothetical protein